MQEPAIIVVDVRNPLTTSIEADVSRCCVIRLQPRVSASTLSERIVAWVEGGRSRDERTTTRRGCRTGCEAGVSSHPCAAAMPWIRRHRQKVSLGRTHRTFDVCDALWWWKRGDCAAMRRHAQRMLSTSRKLASKRANSRKAASQAYILKHVYLWAAVTFTLFWRPSISPWTSSRQRRVRRATGSPKPLLQGMDRDRFTFPTLHSRRTTTPARLV